MHTVLQVSDTHYFCDPGGLMFGIHSRRSLDHVLDYALNHHATAELVLATGDLVHDGSAAGYQALKEALERLEVPVHCLPGNHDNPEVMAAVLNGPRVTCNRAAELADWKIILLDTRVTGSDGGFLARSELDFLERELSSVRNRHVIIVLHHPPVQIGSLWMDDIGLANAAVFLDMIDRHAQVRAVLFGHIHQEFDRLRRGVRLLGAPSTCAQFKPHTLVHVDDPLPPGYRWLRLAGNGRFETGVARLAHPVADDDH